MEATCMALVLFPFNIPHLHVNQLDCRQEPELQCIYEDI